MLEIVPAVAVNVWVLAPAVTVAEAGTASTALLLLVSATSAPPDGAACESITVQVDVPEDPSVLGLQDSELTVAGAVTVSVTPTDCGLFEAPEEVTETLPV